MQYIVYDRESYGEEFGFYFKFMGRYKRVLNSGVILCDLVYYGFMIYFFFYYGVIRFFDLCYFFGLCYRFQFSKYFMNEK